MDYYPIFTRLRHRPVLLVGAGEVGLRKAGSLFQAGARLTVVSISVSPAFAGWAAACNIPLRRRPFLESDVEGQFLVVAATGDESANEEVYRAAERAGIWVNVVDDRKRSSFIVPAIVDRSPLMVAVSTGGCAPVLAKLWKEKLEQWLPRSLGAATRFADHWREQVKIRLPDGVARRHFWESFFRSTVPSLLAAGNRSRARQVTGDLLDQNHGMGFVHLVGAGPGDPELLTIKALQALQQADVVLHDRLVGQEILALARKDARRIAVGKCAGHHSISQEEINRLLVNYARQGLTVCRLKGGDPFVFGRGAEEAQALAAERIPYVVVPGITAAAGCCAYAGIPLTHRDHAHSVVFVTGHCQHNGPQPDWQALARKGQTLVVYMGLGQCRRIAGALMQAGMAASTPAAAISQGTTPQQQVVATRLDKLADDVDAHRIAAPALLVIGEVAALQGQLHWFAPSDDSRRGHAPDAKSAIHSHPDPDPVAR